MDQVSVPFYQAPRFFKPKALILNGRTVFLCRQAAKKDADEDPGIEDAVERYNCWN